MSPSKIEVGKTYRNKGAGRTTRKVLAIGEEYRTDYADIRSTGVLYKQGDKERRLSLASFAQWAGSEAGTKRGSAAIRP